MPGNLNIQRSDSGTDDERLMNDLRPHRRVDTGRLAPPGPAPLMPSTITTPLPSTAIGRSPSPATDISGPTSHVTNSEMSVVVTMIERIERRLAAIESPSTPVSGQLAAPSPRPVIFPIVQPPAEPAASASGGRQGAPPAAVGGGASQGAGGPVRIVNLAGEVIADGFMPPGGDPPDGGPPCPEFLQWDPVRKKYRRRKEECLPLVLEEVEVAEDRPIRAETRMRVLIILRQQHRKSPDMQSLVETL